MQWDFPFKVHDSVWHIFLIAYLEATDSNNAISSDPLAPHQQANSAVTPTKYTWVLPLKYQEMSDCLAGKI